MFLNLDTLSVKSGWFNIQPNRNDLDRFIEVIKKRIDMIGDFEFNEDYTKFRRIESFSEFIKRVDAIIPRGEIGCSIEFIDISEVTFDYSHLPEAKLKTYSSTEWNKKKGRA